MRKHRASICWNPRAKGESVLMLTFSNLEITGEAISGHGSLNSFEKYWELWKQKLGTKNKSWHFGGTE
jgi:hypothetical protein